MTVLRAMFQPETRAVQSLPWGVWPGDSAVAPWSNVRVDNENALRLLTVYGCNRFICEGISTLPVDVFRDTADGPQEAAKPSWLEQPTPELDRVSWLTQVLTSLLLDGNAYCRKGFDGGNLVELTPLNPAAVKPVRERGRKLFRVNGVDVDGFEILHIPAVMFPGSDEGLSPVEAARQTIGKGLSTEEFAARFISGGLNIPGVIETPQDLNDEQAKAMANTFSRRHSGPRKSSLPAVLTNGAKWQSTGVTNEQAQFLETQQFTAAQICAFLFLIDPTEFGVSMDKGSSVTYANLEQRNARKVQVTFLPWIIRIEHALSALIRQMSRYVKFNVAGLLRGDLKTRYESYAIGIESKFLLPNEARELEDRPPLPGGDKFDTPAPAAPASPPADPGEPVEPAPVMIHNHLPATEVHNHNRYEMPITVPASETHIHNEVGVPEPSVELHNHVPPATVEVHNHVEPASVEVHPVLPTERSKRLEYNELGDVVRVVVEE